MIDRNTASDLSDMLTAQEQSGELAITNEEMRAHRGLANALAVRIQAGQPELEAMQDRIISSYAEPLMHLVPTNVVLIDFARTRQYALPLAA